MATYVLVLLSAMLTHSTCSRNSIITTPKRCSQTFTNTPYPGASSASQFHFPQHLSGVAGSQTTEGGGSRGQLGSEKRFPGLHEKITSYRCPGPRP